MSTCPVQSMPWKNQASFVNSSFNIQRIENTHNRLLTTASIAFIRESNRNFPGALPAISSTPSPSSYSSNTQVYSIKAVKPEHSNESLPDPIERLLSRPIINPQGEVHLPLLVATLQYVSLATPMSIKTLNLFKRIQNELPPSQSQFFRPFSLFLSHMTRRGAYQSSLRKITFVTRTFIVTLTQQFLDSRESSNLLVHTFCNLNELAYKLQHVHHFRALDSLFTCYKVLQYLQNNHRNNRECLLGFDYLKDIVNKLMQSHHNYVHQKRQTRYPLVNGFPATHDTINSSDHPKSTCINPNDQAIEEPTEHDSSSVLKAEDRLPSDSSLSIQSQELTDLSSLPDCIGASANSIAPKSRQLLDLPSFSLNHLMPAVSAHDSPLVADWSLEHNRNCNNWTREKSDTALHDENEMVLHFRTIHSTETTPTKDQATIRRFKIEDNDLDITALIEEFISTYM